MRLLLDQGVARSVSRLLREAGHDVLHVSECELTTAEDAEILFYARRDDRVLVTFDADFASLLALGGDRKPSVIYIRIEGLRAEAQAALLVNISQQYGDALAQGAILSIRPHAVRRKSLPIQ